MCFFEETCKFLEKEIARGARFVEYRAFLSVGFCHLESSVPKPFVHKSKCRDSTNLILLRMIS